MNQPEPEQFPIVGAILVTLALWASALRVAPGEHKAMAPTPYAGGPMFIWFIY